MTKFKLLAAAAVLAAMCSGAGMANAAHKSSHQDRYVKPHAQTTMANEYGFQKDMKDNKSVKKPFAVKKHAAKKHAAKKHAMKKHHRMAKKAAARNHGTTPNECIRPPCGMNYDR